MFGLKLIRTYSCFCLLLVSVLAGAQSQVALKFKHLGIKEGLPQSTINSMAQDSTGFIWFGTMGGLCRYDGYSFKTFAHAVGDSNSLPSNNIRTIEVLPNNTLLVGTSKGIAVFDPVYEQFRVVANSIGLEINKVKVTQDGNIWIGTTKGLKRLSLTPLTLHEPGEAFTKYSNSEVYGLEEDNYGRLWICYASNKIVCYDSHSQLLNPIPVSLAKELSRPSLKVNIIKKDEAGLLWFGTFSNGIIGYDFQKKICLTTKEELKNGLRVIMIRDMLFTHHYIWVAARNGLFRFSSNGDGYQVFQAEKAIPYSLSNSSISSLLQDKSGIIWVGTYLGGVNFLQKTDQVFSYFDILVPDKGLTNQIVYSPLYDSARNVLWIGTGGGGLNCYDFRTDRLTSFSVANNEDRKSIDYNYIESLCLLPDQKLLIGTLRGLFLYDPEKKRIVSQKLDSSGRRYAVFALKNDDGGTWIGTQNDIFYRNKLGYFRKSNFPQNACATQSKGEVSALLKDRRNGLWVGRINGLSYKNLLTNKVVYFDHINFLKQQYINSLLEDHTGKIWIGTDENGIVVYDPETERFTSINLLLGLQEKQARGIIESSNGNLWVSSINEIWKITFDREDHTISKTHIKIDRLSADNGLRSNEFSRAATILPDSTLFFGGYSGSVLFKPTILLKNTFVPPVVITDFHVDNLPDARTKILKGLSTVYADNIVIPYQYAYFSFQFAALSFVNSSQNSYAYKMEGLKEDDWHYVGDSRQATYTNLAPGNYTFWVKCANNDGLWNAPHKIRVTILPPIWMTWYAYIVYILIFSGSTLYIFSVYRRTTRLKNELHLQHLRNEMDKEFAEKKINFYTNISHEVKTPLSLILAPLNKISKSITTSGNIADERMTSYLAIMKRNAEKLMGLVKLLLDYRRIESGHMQLQLQQDDFIRFVATIVDNFSFLAKEKGLVLQFVPDYSCLLCAFDPDKMEQILNNLLSNAIKFTPQGGTVAVSITNKIHDDATQEIILVVEDNGIGIEQEHLRSLFDPFHQYDQRTSNGSGIGLTYTKALVELHHGSIHVDSIVDPRPFRGATKFVLRFPNIQTNNIEPPYAGEQLSIITNNHTLSLSENEYHIMSQEANIEKLRDNNIDTLLIVEDNADMLFFLSDHFEGTYNIVTARDGKEGWDLVQRILPDLIVSDLMMPEMDGIELCRLVKEHPATSHIPFILLTAKDTDESKIVGFKSGADDYVCKPFNIELLEVRMENLFRNRRRVHEKYQHYMNGTVEDQEAPSIYQDEFIQKIVSFVHDNIMEPELNVEGLSQFLLMSRITLYRKVKAMTGITVIELIRQIRLQKAAQLLKERKYTVSEVCYKVGFSDIDYFRKIFKSMFGILPSEYR
ncbi:MULTISPECIES: hybrid sensor histidine kinase/response regulator transcription factor [Chitinophagaceae]